MRVLIHERLSKHKMKTKDGYLICSDAILARTGKQTYRKNELFGDSAGDDEIEIDRLPEDVFRDETMTSFENVPLTIEHPGEDVNSTNIHEYAVGFVRDVRKGKDNGQDVIMADLVFNDQRAIDLIESGEMTELSCGYDCSITQDDHPRQINIIGNHVALCHQGRAGNARIVDSVEDNYYGTLPNERRYRYRGYVIVDKGYSSAPVSIEGYPYYKDFRTVEEAKQFIKNGMQDSVKDYSIRQRVDGYLTGFAIVRSKDWNSLGMKAYVEAWFGDKRDAIAYRDSIIANEGIQVEVIDCSAKRQIIDSVNDAVDIDEAIQYYRENAFGYDGLRDYVNTDFGHLPKEERERIYKEMKRRIGDSVNDAPIISSEKEFVDHLRHCHAELDKQYAELSRVTNVEQLLRYFASHGSSSAKKLLSELYMSAPWLDRKELQFRHSNTGYFLDNKSGKEVTGTINSDVIKFQLHVRNATEAANICKELYLKLPNWPYAHAEVIYLSAEKWDYNSVEVRVNGKYGWQDSVHDSRKVYYVYNDDNDYWGPFDTIAEARQQIRRNKQFDKEQGNPFEEEYRIEIEVEDSINDAIVITPEIEKQLQSMHYAVNPRGYMFTILNNVCYGSKDGKTWYAGSIRQISGSEDGRRQNHKLCRCKIDGVDTTTDYARALYASEKGETINPNTEIDHLDGNHDNNVVSNMEPVSSAENKVRRDARIFARALMNKDGYVSKSALTKQFGQSITNVLVQHNGYDKFKFVDSIHDSTRVKDVDYGFCIVSAERYRKHGSNAMLSGWEEDFNSAVYTRDSLERNDGIRYVIIDCESVAKRVIDSVTDAWASSYKGWVMRTDHEYPNKIVFLQNNRLYEIVDIKALMKIDSDLNTACRKLIDSYFDFEKFGINDSVNDVNPHAGESKNDFISRFMSETKKEYPDEKQRLAVAYSYWRKAK